MPDWRPDTLTVLHYPHPALAYPSTPVTSIDADFKATVAEMFRLMYKAKGIGLAANQVGIPRRFFIVNLTAEEADPSEEFVFINPVLSARRGSGTAEEGCLSLPGVYGDVRRPEAVTIQAYGLDGQPFEMKLDDLPARVVQHETDHLDGMMFLQRMDDAPRAELDPQVDEFRLEHDSRQSAGQLPANDALQAELDRMAKA